MIQGIYLHIPFCGGICSYCDFYRRIAPRTLIKQYIEELARDILSWRDQLSHVRTLFLGGGTPSLLTASDLLLLKEALLRAGVDLDALEEVTLEADPADVNQESAKLWHKLGFTRISLGIQSLSNERLAFMKRRHTKEMALSALDALKNRFSCLNVDLIYGFPGDTPEAICEEIDTLASHGVHSFSLYALILEDKTKLGRLARSGSFKTLSDEEERAIYDAASSTLYKKGILCYEVSNFAFPGYASLHNGLYWDYQDYLGLGPSASSKIGSHRFTIAPDLASYLRGERKRSEDLTLSLHDQALEMLMMGLRRPEGIACADFIARYGTEPLEAFPALKRDIAQGVLKLTKERLYIPKQYLYVEDAILCDLFTLGKEKDERTA